jgi:DNA repair protein RadA/Sms
MEGTRPILIELQALASSTNLGTPRRTILGLDSNRVALLVAVMEKKLGLHLMGHDIFMNVAGGVKVYEPAVDLGIVSAIASSFLDRPVQPGTVVVGEVGLTGEVRAVGQLDTRVAETMKMGFSRCIVPQNSLARITPPDGIDLIGAKNISAMVEALF